MKLTKSQLKQIIKEELEAPNLLRMIDHARNMAGQISYQYPNPEHEEQVLILRYAEKIEEILSKVIEHMETNK